MVSPTGKVLIRIPNDLNYLEPTLSFIREMAHTCGFQKDDANNIEMAVEEGIASTIRQSEHEKEPFPIDLEIQPVPAGIEFRIIDMGRPVNVKAFEESDLETLMNENDQRGFGRFMIRKLMDRVEYRSAGNKGNVIHLVKYFRTTCNNPKESPSGDIHSHPEPGKPLSAQAFTIRRLLPEEAFSLEELAYDTYGYSYMYDSIYYPERMVALNQTNEVISVVAVTDDHKLAGHVSLLCNPSLPGVAEMAMAMVHPDYRGYHIIDRLNDKCFEEARIFGIEGLFVHATTLHTYSQLAAKKTGMQAVGLLPGYLMPMEVKGIDTGANERVSPVVSFLLLNEYDAGKLFIPANHSGMIGHLLSKIPVIWQKGKPFETNIENSVFSFQLNPVSSVARLFVYEMAPDIILHLKLFLFRLRRDKISIGELLLNLCDPLILSYFDEIEALGFIFSGILPATARGTFLTMICLNGINPCFDNIKLADDNGQELLDYIRQDYEKRFLG